MTIKKRVRYVLVACLLVGVGAVIACKSDAVAEQLDAWYLLRRPERFTQLYFTDYRQLPEVMPDGSSHTVAFTVRNVEHRPTTYRFRISAKNPANDTMSVLQEGMITLDHGDLATLRRLIVIPPLGERIGIEISLAYDGIAQGERHPTPQQLSIWHWALGGGHANSKRGAP